MEYPTEYFWLLALWFRLHYQAGGPVMIDRPVIYWTPSLREHALRSTQHHFSLFRPYYGTISCQVSQQQGTILLIFTSNDFAERELKNSYISPLIWPRWLLHWYHTFDMFFCDIILSTLDYVGIWISSFARIILVWWQHLNLFRLNYQSAGRSWLTDRSFAIRLIFMVKVGHTEHALGSINPISICRSVCWCSLSCS